MYCCLQINYRIIFSGLFKNAHMQGARVLRNETYFTYAVATKNEGNDADGRFVKPSAFSGRECIQS